MLQTSTRIGVVAERINSSDDNGWRIAMGTVTPVGAGDYIWNFGGIPANSWSVTAHTYCYFNPKNLQFRFHGERRQRIPDADEQSRRGR